MCRICELLKEEMIKSDKKMVEMCVNWIVLIHYKKKSGRVNLNDPFTVDLRVPEQLTIKMKKSELTGIDKLIEQKKREDVIYKRQLSKKPNMLLQ